MSAAVTLLLWQVVLRLLLLQVGWATRVVSVRAGWVSCSCIIC